MLRIAHEFQRKRTPAGRALTCAVTREANRWLRTKHVIDGLAVQTAACDLQHNYDVETRRQNAELESRL
jgi:hypothetical protein